MEHHNNLAILVAGGPTPGINAVTAAATIRARLEGLRVLGIHDGFERIMRGEVDHVTPLTIEAVSRIHFRGGSCIGISQANPAPDSQFLDNALMSLLRLSVTQLITVGGDDTAYSAMQFEARARGRIRLAHVPTTLENDLDLPAHVDTFGFQSARHYGVEIVKNLMVDARTTSSWYFVVTAGHKAGHLALGVGKAVGSDADTHPEECDKPIRLSGAMISMEGGRFVPMPLGGLIDENTRRTRVRFVNVRSTGYAVARRYMIRLRRDDFKDPHQLAELTAAATVSLEDFRRQFEYLVHGEAPPLVFDATHAYDDPLLPAARGPKR